MNSWHSYPSIYNLGHRAIADLLTVPVIVEEKVDGSQFSFGIDEEGELHVRSKGAVMHLVAPEKMFSRAVETVLALKDKLMPGWTYRGEYLAKPKHNTLAYERTPDSHVIIFDVNTGEADYLSYSHKVLEADRIGLECVPCLFEGMLSDVSILRDLLEHQSVLGGQKIEGVVVKQVTPTLFGLDKKALIGKFVSEAFKEIHAGEWKKSNPTDADVVQVIAASLKTPARWSKAVIHLRERGQIEDSPKDIGKLIKEIPLDIKAEFETEIKEKLFAHAWPKIARQVTHGLPEWYKDELLKLQFSTEEVAK